MAVENGRHLLNLSAIGRRNNFQADVSFHCHGNAWSRTMARNFGFHSPVRQNDRAPIWPMWLVAFVAVGVISAATLLPHP
jgi:hypothetical protein